MYAIRIRGEKMVGTITGNFSGIQLVEGETVEYFESKLEYLARKEQLILTEGDHNAGDTIDGYLLDLDFRLSVIELGL